MRLIDVDKLKPDTEYNAWDGKFTAYSVEQIEEAPTVEVKASGDYINREDAIEQAKRGTNNYYICKAIESLPTYEVADLSDEAYEVGYTAGQMAERKRIVRCEDCMFSKVYQPDSNGVEGRFCEAFTLMRIVKDADFCSYGERKDNE